MLRNHNRYADSLTIFALSSDECIPRMIFVELLEQLSIERQMILGGGGGRGVTSTEKPSWLDPYIAFLFDGSWLTNGKETKNVQRTSA